MTIFCETRADKMSVTDQGSARLIRPYSYVVNIANAGRVSRVRELFIEMFTRLHCLTQCQHEHSVWAWQPE